MQQEPQEISHSESKPELLKPRISYGQTGYGLAGYAQPAFDALQERQAVEALRAQQDCHPQEVEEERKPLEEQAARAREQELEAARKEAEQRGYAEGLAKAEESAREAISEQIGRFVSIAAQLADAKTSVLEGAEDMLVEIVYAAVCRMVGAGLASRNGAAGMVKHVLAGLQRRDSLIIRLHPHDVTLMQTALGDRDALPVLPADTVLRADPDIELGGCIVESAAGTLDARLEMQLQRLREALLEARRLRAGEEGSA
ncbi:MAG TPA: FliH/SctL family protein [Paucimonas sp.]|nr:FliH/SctL family protein [Paucimonas sp.]